MNLKSHFKITLHEVYSEETKIEDRPFHRHKRPLI